MAIAKRTFLLCFLFALFATSMLSPIGTFFGTTDYLPKNDFRDHVAATIQAKMAIDEGQFPIRVTPWQYDKMRFAEFQFYGVLPYTLSGTLYKFFSSFHSAILNNPFNAIKLILWLGIIFGGIYAYRFARLFTGSEVVATLAAIAYIFSPYLIINIDYRGDYTEALAQSILPMVCYYSFKIILAKEFKLFDFIFAALAWFALLASHLITFAYAALFFVLTTIIFLIVRITNFKQSCYAAGSFILAWLLAAWYVIPIALLSSHLAVGGEFDGRGLKPTSLFNLFAIRSGLSSEVSPSWPGIYSAIGMPLLFGFLTCLYFIFYPNVSRRSDKYKLMLSVTFLFLVAIFMAWSWINFWKYLPNYFSVGEWGYRFLAQIMWLGVILFVLAIEDIFNQPFDMRHLVVGIFIICFATSSWISQPSGELSVSSLTNSPDLLFAEAAYLMSTEKLPAYPDADKYGFVQIPLVTADSRIVLDHPAKISSKIFTPKSSIVLKGKMLDHSNVAMIKMKVNGNIIATKTVKPNDVIDWNIPLEERISTQQPFTEITVSQKLANNLLDTTPSYLNKILPFIVDKFELKNDSITSLTVIPVDKIKPFCTQNKKILECKIENITSRQAIQLPVIYYPNMLDIRIDGNKVAYEPTIYRNTAKINNTIDSASMHGWNPLTLTTIVLPEGSHKILSQNVGMRWANILSLSAWSLLIFLGIYGTLKNIFRKK